ncbi:MAG: DUF2796 domain-containing protein [Limnohabitans sp.]|nr:DUF2796 domain-containing protein [Limnohabitans sp.]
MEKMTKLLLNLLSLPLVLLSAQGVFAEDHQGHAAHSHGMGILDLSIHGKTVKASFEIPMESLLGHEYLPRSADQKKAMADLKAGVAKASYFMSFPAAAQCQEKSVKTESAMFEGKKSEHADLDADLEVECAKPEALTQIEFPLFAKHRRLGSLKVNMVGPKGQKSLTVKAKDPVLRW